MLTTVFKKVASYAPSVAMIIGGGFMTVDGFMHGRPDVGLGGFALSAIGMELTALARNKNRILGIFNMESFGDVFRPGDRMAFLGLAACALLGGGEIANMMERHSINSETLHNKEMWNAVFADAGSIKVLANLTVYPLASILDFHRVEEFARKHKMEKLHRLTQTALLIVGAGMIARFGEVGKIFSARMFGRLNYSAGLVRLGQLATAGNNEPDASTESIERKSTETEISDEGEQNKFEVKKTEEPKAPKRLDTVIAKMPQVIPSSQTAVTASP